MADRLAPSGIHTYVAYPEIASPPRPLSGSVAEPVTLSVTPARGPALEPVLRFIRENDIEVLYLTDFPTWSWAYPAMRHAGVRRIVVHDHVSGEFERPHGVKRLLKTLLMRSPSLVADQVIAVSDFVATRQREVGCFPDRRLVRIWNGLTPTASNPDCAGRAHSQFGIDPCRPLVMSTCRAAKYKGVHHLLRAFDSLLAGWRDPVLPVLVYAGDGPDMEYFRQLHQSLPSRDHMILAGYRSDARELVASADVCVIPSLWAEACPLAVLEPMMAERPIVASAVGGIPELVLDSETGLLVPPGDEPALARAIARLITNQDLARQLAAAARRRAVESFSFNAQIDALVAVMAQCFDLPVMPPLTAQT
ncbi:MAG TPA: glycosyltransferase family 4 protein [Bryobacteraceae bacterium]|nr:glycosyltransferase family 4 protein [Bryobacteraceae bacterium]